MAQLSSQFASISPGMETEQAQEGLVSIMKAWDIDPDDVKSEIMDNINILGNSFAESNADIVEGMKRSAAALSAVGTEYKDAFALFTGAQEILQNAEVTGRALRSISMRVRGYSEESEGGFEELDDELKTITGDLIDLTKTAEHSQGVSVLKEGSTTEYKSLVDYFGEISEIWDEMSQVQQNNFLQKAFGKTQAQAGAALIQNFEAVRGSLETMENAAGSADREMSIVAETLNYKINALKQTWVGTVQEMIDRGDFGKLIDSLTRLSEGIGNVASSAGLLGSVAAGIGAVAGIRNNGIIKTNNNELGQATSLSMLTPSTHSSLTSTRLSKQDIKILQDYTRGIKTNLTPAVSEHIAKAKQLGMTNEELAASFRTVSIGAKIASASLKVLSIAGNMLLFMAIGKGISLAIEGINNLIHASERAVEKMEETKSKISELNSTYEQHATLIKESGDRYAELSSKMSSLSTEELEEFNDLNKQFTEAFPGLITGFNNQGDAIAYLGSNAEEAKKKLQEMLDQEKETANYEIFKNLDDLYGGTKVKLDKAIESQEKFNRSIEIANKRLIKEDDFTEFGLTLDYKNEPEKASQIISSFRKVLEDFRVKALENGLDENEDLNSNVFKAMQEIERGDNFNEQTGIQDIWVSLINWTPEQRKLFKQMLQDESNEIMSLIRDSSEDVNSKINDEIGNLTIDNDKVQQEAESAWRDYTNNLANAMQSQQTFKDIDDTELQDIAVAMVRGLDRSLYEESGDIDYSYIRKNILNALKNLGEDARFEVKKAYQKLLALDPNDISTENQLAIDEIIKTLAELLGQDPIQLRIAFGFEEDNSFQETMNKAYSKFGTKHDDRGFALRDEELDNFAKENSINTKEEVEFWNKCIEESDTREEAMKKYLAESSEDNTQKFTKFQMIDTINGMSDGFDILDAIYADVKDGSTKKGKAFDFTNLDTKKFEEQFKGLEDEYYNFIDVVSASPTDIKKCQDAFNELTTAYVNQKGILSNLTDENKDVTINMLEMMGISNADKVVTDKLNAEKEVAKNKAEALAAATKDMGKVSSDATDEFFKETNMTHLAKMELADLIATETIFNDTELSTEDRVEKLNNLAAAYYGVKNAISLTPTKMSEDSAMKADSRYTASIEDQFNNAKDKANEEYQKNLFEYTGSGNHTEKTDTKNKTDERFDYIEIRLEKLAARTEKFKQKFEDAFTLDEIDDSYKKVMTAIRKEIEFTEKAADKYAKKANKIDLPEKYKKKIRNGSLDIEKITDEDLKKKMEEYQNYYNKSKDAKKTGKELKKEESALAMQYGDKILDRFEGKSNLRKSKTDRNDSLLELYDSQGKDIGSKDYRDLRNANVTLADEEVTGAKAALDKYKVWYKENKKDLSKEDKQAAKINIQNLKAEYNEAKKLKKEANEAIFEDDMQLAKWEQDEINSRAESLESDIALKEAQGLSASKKDYQQRISISNEAITNLDEQNRLLKDQQKGLSEDSAKYQELQADIDANDEAIKKAKQSQVEWNNSIDGMKLEGFQKLSDLLNTIISRFEKFKTLAELHGNNISDEKIDKQFGLIDESNRLNAGIKEGYLDDIKRIGASANFTPEQIQQIIEFAEAGRTKDIEALVTSLGKDWSELGEFSDAINDYIGAYDAELDNAIEAEELLDMRWDNQIKKINEITEVYQKQKEIKDRQLATEKSIYELEKAKSNLNKKVWNGEQWVYTADKEAIQSAQEAFDNNQYDNLIDALGDLTEALEKEKENVNLLDDEGNALYSGTLQEVVAKVLADNGLVLKSADSLPTMDGGTIDYTALGSNLSGANYTPQYNVPAQSYENVRNSNSITIQNLEITMPNINDSSTARDMVEGLRSELVNLGTYAKQFNWNS